MYYIIFPPPPPAALEPCPARALGRSVQPLRAPALHLQRDLGGALHEGVDLRRIDAQPQGPPVHRLCAAPRLA